MPFKILKPFLILGITVQLLLFSHSVCWAGFQTYGEISSTLTGSDYLTGTYDNTLDGDLLFTQNFKFDDQNVSGFLSIKGLYENDLNKFSSSLDKAYVLYQTGVFAFELGKDRVVTGVGYAWNPADILNPRKSSLYSDSEKRNENEGIFLTSLTTFGAKDNFSYELKGIIVPALETENSKWVISSKMLWGNFEFGMLGGYQNDQAPIYTGYFRTPCPGIEAVTLYGEYRAIANSEDWQSLIGMQLNPKWVLFGDGGIQFQLEYFKNGNGYQKTVGEWLVENPEKVPIVGEIFSNYAYCGVSIYTLNFVSALGFMGNLDSDRSGLINFVTSFSLSDESKLNFGGFFTYGEEDCEFPLLINKKSEIYLTFSIAFSLADGNKE